MIIYIHTYNFRGPWILGIFGTCCGEMSLDVKLNIEGGQMCGDQKVDTGEECDDGNTLDGDG
jgi:hypothetical protein